MGFAAERLPAIVGLMLLLAGWQAAPAGAADPIVTRFDVFGFAGIRVLTLHSRTEESGARYAITADYATEGMASVFVNLTTHAQVQGRLVGDAVQPELFRNDSRRNGVEHHSRVDYRPDGTVIGGSTPPPATPVTPAAARRSVDNLTAYFRLERQVARTGSCALTERVFDGRHGYDLAFSDAGRAALAPTGGQNFAGVATACHMVRREWPDFPDPDKNEGARSGTIWYAKLLPGDLMVPVRMQMDTQLGTVDGYLARLHGRGVDRALME